MKLLILCTVFSVFLAVSFASPVKTQILDVADSAYNSDECDGNKNGENNLSSLEDGDEAEERLVGNTIVKIKKDEDNSSISQEEKTKSENLIKDANIDASSSEEDNIKTKKHVIFVFDEDDILDLHQLTHKSKRSFNVDYNSYSNNNLKVKDEGSIKYEKYLKLKSLRHELESNESNDSNDLKQRFVRNAETSEESSSEENKKAANPDTTPTAHINLAANPKSAKTEAARRRRNANSSEENSSEENKNTNEKPVAKSPASSNHTELAAKPETAAEITRRRRNSKTSEENSSEEYKEPKKGKHNKNIADLNSASGESHQFSPNQDINEVFVFSNENQLDSEENLKIKTLNFNKYEKKKSSDEDYAQGCGNNDNDSNLNY